MTKHRVLLWMLLGVMTLSVAEPALAAPAPKEKTPPVGQRAGAISALLPVASVTRGAGKTALKNDLKKGDELFWNDLVQTAKGGRARITLADQSILSLGSQAELRIVKHDAKSQQTLLQMTYGRVRAEVSQITRDGGRFEVRTPTAVAGVIGTDFGTESGVGSTTFVCISGAVSVSNSDPNVPGSVQCGAGQTTTVATGKAPTTPVPATPAQIQQLITDTEPAQISAMSPAAALPGATLDASVSGTKLNGTNAVQIAGGAGVTVTLNQGTTDTTASLHVVVAANAAPGPRTITLAKASGTNSATVFTVLAPPDTAQNTSGDPKKPYHDTLDQLRQTGESSVGTIVAALQQVVDQANQALTQANQNLAPGVDLSQANSGLNGQISALQTAASTATQQIDQAAGSAASSFDSAYTSAYNALLQRNSGGTPDDTFNQAVNTAFQNASNALQQAIVEAQNSLGGQVQSAGNQIGQISQSWLNTINTTASSQMVGPTPASNGIEKSVDVGAEITLDASNSKAGQGASIVSYNWSLCDASYKPGQFGVPLVGNPAGCNALPGMMSSNAQFTIATCGLTPGDYIARETVVDTNQKIASQDVKIHVLAGSYDDPATRLKNLAAAYSALQVSQFLSFFDQTNFSGYTALSQNVQSTFPTLASMNINVIVSQNTQTCNQANLRANWDLNYQDKPVCSSIPVLDANGNPTGETKQVCSTPPLLKASEQLQVRMNRTPGVGWLISDFQGDNGTVTNNVGALPAGPSAATFSAEPDVVVAGVQIANSVNANNAVNVAGNTTTDFIVTVANSGDADLTSVMPVHFAIRDGSGNELVSANQNIPTPLAKGGTAQMTVSMAVPNLAPQTPLSYVVTANPGCSVTEKNCGADNVGNLPFLVGIPLPDLRITGISYSPVVPNTALVAPGQETFTVNLINAGSLALTAPTTVHFVFSDASGTLGSSDANITVPLSGGATTSVAATFTIPASGPGAQFTLAAVANPNCTVQEIFCATDPLQSANVKVAIGQANYIVVPGTLTFGGKSGPFTGANAIQVGTSPAVGVTVQNAGNVTQSGSITVTFACTGPSSCNNPLVATIAAPAAGQSVVASAPSNGIDNTPGTYTGTATLSTNLPQSSTADDSASQSFDVFDYTLTSANASANPVTIFLGGNFDLSALVTETGSTLFPMPITATTGNGSLTVTAPTALTSGSAQNVNVAAAFTATTGATNLTVSASNQGITKTITQPLSIVAPFVQTASPTMQSGLISQPLTLQVNTAGSLTLGTLPNGVSIDPQAACSPGAQTTANATVRVAGSVTWCLQANASSATGALTAPMSMTATNPADFSGTYTVPVTMSVNGIPDYTVSAVAPNFTVGGHSGSFTGGDALVLGETTNASVVVSNAGNASPVGPITVTISCAGGNFFCTPASTNVNAPAAGQTVAANIAMPLPGGAGAGYTYTVALTGAPAQADTTNDSFTQTIDVIDFSIAFSNGSGTPINQFYSGSTTLNALLTVTGTTGFPALAVAQSISGAGSITVATPPTTLTPGVATPISVDSPTAGTQGAAIYALSGTYKALNRSASQAFNVIAPFVQATAPALTQGGASNALSVTSNTTGNLTLGTLPTGISIDGTAACSAGALTGPTATVGPSQTVTWCLQAAGGSATGALTAPLTITGTFVTYTGNVTLSVGAAPNYVVTSTDLNFVGHGTPGGPYTGANAIQSGETFNLVVTVHNTGSASPTGTITVHLACTPPPGNNTTQCQTSPPDQTVAAPAAGSPAQVTFSGLQFNDPVGVAPGYTGTVTITATDASNNPIPETSTADNTASDSFDLTDFQVTLPNLASFTPLYILSSGNGTFQAQVTESGTTNYTVATNVSSPSVLTIFAPGSVITGAAASTIQVNTSGQTGTGATSVTFSATNHGVTRSATQPIVVLAESLTLNGSSSGTSLYLNDSGHPLELQVGATPLTITLKLTGDNFTGNATVSATPLSFFTNSPMQATVTAGGTFDWQVGAQAGAPTTVQQLQVSVQMPQSNGTPPNDKVTFILYVQALGVPDLVLSNFTTSGSASPWLSGQGLDFQITLNNNGGSASAGGEAIIGALTVAGGDSDLGCQVTSPVSGVPSIPAGGNASVTVHCVAPDLHDTAYTATAPISFKIAPDAAGDVNYTNNRLSGTIPFANWHATVGPCAAAPCGVSDGAPLTLTIVSGGPTWSATSIVTTSIDGGGSSTSTLNVGQGALSSGLNLLSGAGTVAPSGSFTPTVSTGNGSLQNGFYFAQLTLSLTDATTGKTATRQATIHVAVNNQNITSPGGSVTFTASCAPGGNGTGCMSNATPVQINGALAQQITVTGNCATCASGGTYDFSVHDDPLTTTSVNQSGAQYVNNTSFGVAQTLTVTATQDASGNIATGPANTYTVNATSAQLSRVRGISPDSGGFSQPVYFQVGDIDVNVTPMYANACINVPPNGPQVPVTVNWVLSGGFNQPSISYQLQNSNNSPVGSGPIAFSGSAGGTLNYSGGYAALNFGLSNTAATDGLQAYYLAVTITNGISSATKYFPFYVDGSLSQNFCGAVSGVRGGTARIRGTWNRAMLGGVPGTLSAVRSKAVTTGKGMPDLRISSSDISYSPSIPKAGDTVSFRFRITNAGDADAVGVPVALQVDGATVAADTFDVRAGGSTLAGLSWTSSGSGAAAVPASVRRAAGIRSMYADGEEASVRGASGLLRVSAALVIDPQHTVQQKTTLAKVAAVPRFGLQPGTTDAGLTTSPANSQRILLEIEEGACVGLRLTTGSTGMCGSADVEFTVEDLAKGAYKLEALNGVGDLGLNLNLFGGGSISAAQRAGVRYASDAMAQAGHSYSVQLNGGRTGTLTIASVRSPGQLDAKTRAIFHATAIKVLKGLGADSQAPTQAGDISGMGTEPVVFVELLLSDSDAASPAARPSVPRPARSGSSEPRVQ